LASSSSLFSRPRRSPETYAGKPPLRPSPVVSVQQAPVAAILAEGPVAPVDAGGKSASAAVPSGSTEGATVAAVSTASRINLALSKGDAVTAEGETQVRGEEKETDSGPVAVTGGAVATDGASDRDIRALDARAVEPRYAHGVI
jgi:hypothetical protein